MTSEVLILNKRAVVLAADSAVTTSGGDHPRYSKSANKIFELSQNGTVAATIYGNANLDLVPWEVALKMFRSRQGHVSFNKLSEYTDAVIAFLSGNNQLFPPEIRAKQTESQFDVALKLILENVEGHDRLVFDVNVPEAERKDRWLKQKIRVKDMLDGWGIADALTQAPLDLLLENPGSWEQRARSQLEKVPSLAGIDPLGLAQLGLQLRYACPQLVLPYTGLVIAGYGDEQLFPTYQHLKVYGHIGNELFYENVKSFEVTHAGIAMIQPLAQTSMIEMFTDGFSPSLEKIISSEGEIAIRNVFDELRTAGTEIAQDVEQSIRLRVHEQFMKKWKMENWKQNFHPLIDVLQSLNVQEMAHLAESLLSLESLKERVTSPSETVGGPIDVAAITKSEGLIWIKRKHFFDPGLNMRYAARLERSLNER